MPTGLARPLGAISEGGAPILSGGDGWIRISQHTETILLGWWIPTALNLDYEAHIAGLNLDISKPSDGVRVLRPDRIIEVFRSRAYQPCE